jgi:hypothetical protein
MCLHFTLPLSFSVPFALFTLQMILVYIAVICVSVVNRRCCYLTKRLSHSHVDHTVTVVPRHRWTTRNWPLSGRPAQVDYAELAVVRTARTGGLRGTGRCPDGPHRSLFQGYGSSSSQERNRCLLLENGSLLALSGQTSIVFHLPKDQ